MNPDDDTIELVEGDEAPPEVELQPVDGEGLDDDPHMTGAEDLTRESYKADLDDDKTMKGMCDHG